MAGDVSSETWVNGLSLEGEKGDGKGHAAVGTCCLWGEGWEGAAARAVGNFGQHLLCLQEMLPKLGFLPQVTFPPPN